jgi:glycoprotein endo-alpha-1,2-mannosidase
MWLYTNITKGNAINQKSRLGGQYYDDKWMKAIEAQPRYISVTSYNEWMEGTNDRDTNQKIK